MPDWRDEAKREVENHKVEDDRYKRKKKQTNDDFIRKYLEPIDRTMRDACNLLVSLDTNHWYKYELKLIESDHGSAGYRWRLGRTLQSVVHAGNEDVFSLYIDTHFSHVQAVIRGDTPGVSIRMEEFSLGWLEGIAKRVVIEADRWHR